MTTVVIHNTQTGAWYSEDDHTITSLFTTLAQLGSGWAVRPEYIFRLLQSEGRLYHPEESAADTSRIGDGTPLFTDFEAISLDYYMRLQQEAGVDICEIALAELNRGQA